MPHDVAALPSAGGFVTRRWIVEVRQYRLPSTIEGEPWTPSFSLYPGLWTFPQLLAALAAHRLEDPGSRWRLRHTRTGEIIKLSRMLALVRL